MPSFEVGGRTIEIPVRVSSRSRRPKLVVDARRSVEIVVPPRTPARTVDAMLALHRGWLERQLAKPPRPFVLGLQRDDVVWIGGAARPLPGSTRLDRWYREQARSATVAAVDAESHRLGLTYGRISIRDQRTRWASCSAGGALSFNWRLVLAPPAVLGYVVVHELCHRIRADHSRDFWRVVETARPSYREERQWLRRHGAELLAYRVPPPAIALPGS